MLDNITLPLPFPLTTFPICIPFLTLNGILNSHTTELNIKFRASYLVPWAIISSVTNTCTQFLDQNQNNTDVCVVLCGDIGDPQQCIKKYTENPFIKQAKNNVHNYNRAVCNSPQHVRSHALTKSLPVNREGHIHKMKSSTARKNMITPLKINIFEHLKCQQYRAKTCGSAGVSEL